jgi:4-amino-4-deoxychorismate lyase
MSAAATPELILIDGEPANELPVTDRGLQYGDGLFETLACRDGRARLLSLHIERLALGCERLGMRCDALDAIRAEISAAARVPHPTLIKLIVTRGDGVRRGYHSAAARGQRRVLLRYRHPQESPELALQGVCVRIASTRLGENPALAGIKHLNRLEQVLAASEAPQDAAAEALMLSSSGRLVSGTMTNVFLVQEDRLITPRVDRCGVAGVMRRLVLQLAAACGLDAAERNCAPEALHTAREIFLTNARIGIWPVRRVAERALPVGEVTRRLQRELSARLADA